MPELVLLRHGESEWNRKNLFTGWTDVDLTDKGVMEAQNAGRLMNARGLEFDMAFTSVLKRAIRTLFISLDEMDRLWIPVEKSWRLNERHYGALQGLNKADIGDKYGQEQLKSWRRSRDVRPPALTADDERYPGHDPRYAHLDKEDIPLTECLGDCLNRFFPYWHDRIVPELKCGKNILIAAHGNTLRALVQRLNHLSNEDVIELEIPTGKPLLYTLDDQCHSLSHEYL